MRNNDGTPVAPGTVIHVQVLNNGGGDVTTADTDPTLAGAQIVVSPDGKVRVQVSLPGSPSTLNLGAFSHLGTIDGTADIALP